MLHVRLMKSMFSERQQHCKDFFREIDVTDFTLT
jgi:hypothetical protein